MFKGKEIEGIFYRDLNISERTSGLKKIYKYQTDAFVSYTIVLERTR
jgi:hypothetical protein